jgi:hypothetical protein
METTLESKQNSKTARLGASLFFGSLPLALWGELYVPSKIYVPKDVLATANNVLSNEFIFRTAIVCNIASILFFASMMLMFYQLLKPVDKNLARLMIVPLLAQIPIVFISEAFNYAALMILKGNLHFTFDGAKQQEFAYFMLRMHRYVLGPTKFFLGLSFIPFGLLVLRSGFAPRIIGILLIIAGAGYVVDSSTYILLERPDYLMIGSYLRSGFLGFVLALMWFLIKGVRTSNSQIKKEERIWI